jgi:hypothetical protein
VCAPHPRRRHSSVHIEFAFYVTAHWCCTEANISCQKLALCHCCSASSRPRVSSEACSVHVESSSCAPLCAQRPAPPCRSAVQARTLYLIDRLLRTGKLPFISSAALSATFEYCAQERNLILYCFECFNALLKLDMFCRRSKF